MTTITYVGTHRKVWLPDDIACVKRGDSVEVPDDLADELLARHDKGVPQWTTTTPAPADDPIVDATEPPEEN